MSRMSQELAFVLLTSVSPTSVAIHLFTIELDLDVYCKNSRVRNHLQDPRNLQQDPLNGPLNLRI